ncbi:hypothetical protein CLAUR_007500 [Clostridium felsineum]|nr:hypothetical protein CLAUR_007500 [Clostridium felsineum]
MIDKKIIRGNMDMSILGIIFGFVIMRFINRFIKKGKAK